MSPYYRQLAVALAVAAGTIASGVAQEDQESSKETMETTGDNEKLSDVQRLKERLYRPGYEGHVRAREMLMWLSKFGTDAQAAEAAAAIDEFDSAARKWVEGFLKEYHGLKALSIRGEKPLPANEMAYLYWIPEARPLVGGDIVLTGKELTDDHLAYLSGLPHVRILEIHHTSATGAFLDELNMPDLTVLHLCNSPVGDAAIEKAALAGVEVLDLTGTEITNAALRHFPRDSLGAVWIGQTAVNADGLRPLLMDCEGLEEIRADAEDLNESVIAQINRSKSMRWLYVRCSAEERAMVEMFTDQLRSGIEVEFVEASEPDRPDDSSPTKQ